jgi:aryl-alcohol dehydrogenase-like predicted oxidoreductase
MSIKTSRERTKMNLNNKVILGRTGLRVGRLGIASSFGAPAEAYEAAFNAGCNYFTWGTFIKGGSKPMKQAIRNIVSNGKRNELVIALYSYSHMGFLMERLLKNDLRALDIEYADVLILGYFQKKPGKGIMSAAIKLKEKGLVRHLGISSHNRKLFPVLEREKIFDIFHLRYNAANRGAEVDIFPYLDQNRAGIVSYTATRWRQLLKQKNMPEHITAPSASDCYRFVLSNQQVDVSLMGARSIEQMHENLSVLKSGPMDEREMSRMTAIGDYVYKR